MTTLTPPQSDADRARADRVRGWLVQHGRAPSSSSVAEALRDDGSVWGNEEVLRILDLLRSELVGFGPLERWVRHPDVSDVLVNGPDEVYVDRGSGLERVGVRLPDAASVRRLAQRLAATAGRRLDDAAPWVDARLTDGVRLHAVLPPIAPRGTLISLRVPRAKALTMPELLALGTVTPLMAATLERIVLGRLAFLVTGGTGTGKTTLLGSLLGLVPPTERILVVEDTGELRPEHPHVVRLEARPPNMEAVGEVTLRSLVRQALRMRPDRLVVGEVRGPEVLDLLAALNTGHEGSCGTVHANSATAVPARIEALGATAGLGREAVATQLETAIDVVVALRRRRDGVRQVSEICLLTRVEGVLRTLVALDWDGPAAGYEQLQSRLAAGDE